MKKFRFKQPRKIVSFRYSFLVSLPISWVKHHGIGKGCYVDFEMDKEGNLKLIPLKEKKNEKITR